MQSESALICDDTCCSYAIKKKDEIERVAKANRWVELVYLGAMESCYVIGSCFGSMFYPMFRLFWDLAKVLLWMNNENYWEMLSFGGRNARCLIYWTPDLVLICLNSLMHASGVNVFCHDALLGLLGFSHPQTAATLRTVYSVLPIACSLFLGCVIGLWQSYQLLNCVDCIGWCSVFCEWCELYNCTVYSFEVSFKLLITEQTLLF